MTASTTLGEPVARSVVAARSRRIGLALGAGGAVGRAFHVGVLAAIHDVTGWDARAAEIVMGTSAGSIVAALLRAGLSPRDYAAWTVGDSISPEAARFFDRTRADPVRPARAPAPRWRPAAPGLLLRAAARPWTIRVGTLAAAALPEGAVPSEGIVAMLDPLFGPSWPDRPLWVCAVRLDDGARVVFGRERAPAVTVAEAVAASCAIPGWFAPVLIGEARHVDGGAYSACSLDALAGLDLDVAVVSSPMSAVPAALAPTPDGALRAFSHLQLRREGARVRRSGTAVLAIEPDREDLKVMGSVADSMDRSRRAAVVRHVRRSIGARLRESRAAELLGARSPAGSAPRSLG